MTTTNLDATEIADLLEANPICKDSLHEHQIAHIRAAHHGDIRLASWVNDEQDYLYLFDRITDGNYLLSGVSLRIGKMDFLPITDEGLNRMNQARTEAESFQEGQNAERRQ